MHGPLTSAGVEVDQDIGPSVAEVKQVRHKVVAVGDVCPYSVAALRTTLHQ